MEHVKNLATVSPTCAESGVTVLFFSTKQHEVAESPALAGSARHRMQMSRPDEPQ